MFPANSPLHGIEVLIWIAVVPYVLILLLKPRLGLYIMLFLEPLRVSLLIESGVTLVRIVGIVTFLAWGAGKLLRKEPLKPLLKNTLAAPVLFYLVLCGVSVLWSNFGGWRVEMFSYIQLALWIAMLLDLVNSPIEWERVFFFLFLGTVITCGIGLAEYLTLTDLERSYYRFAGGMGKPTSLAMAFIFVLPFLMMYVIRKPKVWYRLLAVFGIGVSLLFIGLSVTRTMAILLILLFILQFTELPGLGRKVRFALIIVSLLLITAQFWPWPSIEYRFAMLEDEFDASTYGRGWMVQYSIQHFLEKPFLGRGLGVPETGYFALHNIFLEALVRLGLPGLLSMGWIWGAAWISLSKARKRAKDLGMKIYPIITTTRTIFVLYLVYSMFFSTQTDRFTWLMFALAEICFQMVGREEQIAPVQSQAYDRLKDVIITHS